MKLIPIYDDTAPVACTATSDELPVRIAQIERMRSQHTGLERTDHGIVLHFPDDPEIKVELERFAVDEKGCYAFWGFDVVDAGDGLSLRWDGPPSVDEFMDRLVAFFEGDEPLTAESGLL